MRLFKWLFFMSCLILFAIWNRHGLPVGGWLDGALGGLLLGGALIVAITEVGRYYTLRTEPELNPEPGEAIRMRGVVSWSRGVEVVRGKAYLTDRALHFRARSRSRSPIAFDLPLREISELRPTNHRGIFPVGLDVHTHTGKHYRLLSEDRRAWQKAIEGLRVDRARSTGKR